MTFSISIAPRRFTTYQRRDLLAYGKRNKADAKASATPKVPRRKTASACHGSHAAKTPTNSDDLNFCGSFGCPWEEVSQDDLVRSYKDLIRHEMVDINHAADPERNSRGFVVPVCKVHDGRVYLEVS